MLTIEALRALYVKMGGNAADVADLELTPDIIEAIKDIYEDKGDTLPAVTDADNGMALLVQEGAWDKGTLPSGLPEVSEFDNNKSLRVVNGEWAVDSDTFVATFTPNETMTSVTCDKTFAEITDAYIAGKRVVGHLILTASGDYGIAPLLAIGKIDGEIASVNFANTGLNQGVIMSALIVYDSEGPALNMATITPDA